MPTYRNDSSTKAHTIEDLDGQPLRLAPGESGQTYKFYGANSDLTQTAETPLKNIVTAQTSVTLTSHPGAAHTLATGTKKLLLYNVSDTVTMRPQTATAEPMLYEATSETVRVLFDVENDHPCDRVYLAGSGTVTVMEMSE